MSAPDPSSDASGRCRIALVGGLGRLGRAIVASARGHARVEITTIVHRTPQERVEGIPVVSALPGSGIDAIVDVSTPDGVLGSARAAARHRIGLVVGATGLPSSTQSLIEETARVVPVVRAPNLSRGATALLALARETARLLSDFDIEITESHHRHKRDAPSGTARAIVDAITHARPELVARVGRDEASGVREPHEIGVHSVRGGDIVGEHTITFAGDGERVELTHRAGSRTAFARGALDAALFVSEREAGLYEMRDVLDRGEERPGGPHRG